MDTPLRHDLRGISYEIRSKLLSTSTADSLSCLCVFTKRMLLKRFVNWVQRIATMFVTANKKITMCCQKIVKKLNFENFPCNLCKVYIQGVVYKARA